MFDLYNIVKQAIPKVDTNSDKTDQIKNDVTSRLASAEKAIENAYRE